MKSTLEGQSHHFLIPNSLLLTCTHEWLERHFTNKTLTKQDKELVNLVTGSWEMFSFSDLNVNVYCYCTCCVLFPQSCGHKYIYFIFTDFIVSVCACVLWRLLKWQDENQAGRVCVLSGFLSRWLSDQNKQRVWWVCSRWVFVVGTNCSSLCYNIVVLSWSLLLLRLYS